MSEILFRGKNIKDEWVEGSLVVTNNFIRKQSIGLYNQLLVMEVGSVFKKDNM